LNDENSLYRLEQPEYNETKMIKTNIFSLITIIDQRILHLFTNLVYRLNKKDTTIYKENEGILNKKKENNFQLKPFAINIYLNGKISNPKFEIIEFNKKFFFNEEESVLLPYIEYKTCVFKKNISKKISPELHKIPLDEGHYFENNTLEEFYPGISEILKNKEYDLDIIKNLEKDFLNKVFNKTKV
jgi:hypothetical protein